MAQAATRKPHGKDVSTALKGVSLQHRHYAFIARTIAELDMALATHEDIVKHFADACARTNPRFNRDRFERACDQLNGEG